MPKECLRRFDVNVLMRPKQRSLNSIFEERKKESYFAKLKRRLGFAKKPPPGSRTIWVNHRPPPRRDSAPEIVKPQKYPSNQIKTSKYTIWNFLPKNLFEQFRRIANFYFLVIAVIQATLPNSPVSPMTCVLPLIFVVAVTALKQGYEDYLRHKNDNSVNNRRFIIIKEGKECYVKAKDLKVGDIVKVSSNREFPCDLLMLSSVKETGECHITTANLDGETNLKVHFCVPETKGFMTAESFSNLHAVIECELPNSDLYRFKGRLKLRIAENGSELICPLGPDNVLLRGASLKNTAYIFGCVIYTGQQTKMALNSKMTSNKFSTVERSMNVYLVIFLLLLVAEVSMCAALQYGYHSDPKNDIPWYIYIPPDELHGVWHVIENVLSYTVLLNYTIPISMYVTLEMQKFLGSLFFEWDEQLYDPVTDQCAKCNTSDLNEELGQVQYLFTDKTGTLTENDMQFRQCSVNSTRFQEFAGMLCKCSDSDEQQPEIIRAMELNEVKNFFLSLALCHTAQVTRSLSNGSINRAFTEEIGDDAGATALNGSRHGSYAEEIPEYQASSPDEKALLEACSRFGIVFHGVENDKYRITVKGRELEYERLHVLEFDSDRKCMSVIVRNPKGQVYLYCKGAETSVLSRSDSGPAEETLRHVNEYAMLGLRTLVVAERRLNAEEYEQFDDRIRSARSSLEDREKKVAQVFESVERDLHVIGATAVEDRLQDGVPETLQALRLAGIKIWMLTGDKEETAVNIGFACGHFNYDMTPLYLTKQRDLDTALNTMHELKKRVDDNPPESEHQFFLVVDGGSLAHIFASEFIAMFQEVCSVCKAVICCRMSPIQKAMVVRLIKKSKERPITAAIGDGANDVSMIQEAHLGLGLMGKEGRQAVRCSDFAFARFRFLQRVLLVHGHYYYVRVATLVQYSFYKNLAFITPQFYYIFYAWYSPQPLYDGMFLTFYNILFTSAPILVFGLLEQNIAQERLMADPTLYLNNAKNALLSHSMFAKWMLLGIWHSLVFFYGAFFLFENDLLSPYGWTLDMWCMGTLVFHVSVIVINLKLCLETRFFTGIFIFSVIISILGFVMIAMVYSSSTIWKIFSGETSMLWVYFQLLASASFWFCSTLMVVVSLIPDLILGTLPSYLGKITRSLLKVMGRGEGSARVTPTDEGGAATEVNCNNNNNQERVGFRALFFKAHDMNSSQANIMDTYM